MYVCFIYKNSISMSVAQYMNKMYTLTGKCLWTPDHYIYMLVSYPKNPIPY